MPTAALSWVVAALLLQAAVASAAGSFGSPQSATKSVTRVSLTEVYHHTDRRFKSWNIDPSGNRGWELRNLSRAAAGGEKLYALAKASRPGYLRFGGGGADTFAYDIPGGPAPYLNGSALPGELEAKLGKQPPHCLNTTWLLNLLEFADYSGASLIFGLDINVRTANDRWDPAPAKALIQFATAHGHKFFGFELVRIELHA